MTAGDLPATTGNPDQGFEGYRFVGYNLYDSLVLWDLSGKDADKAADIKPGLATEWQVDEANPKRWIFKLRQGVKLHDGCDFTADDVVWNMAYSTDEKAPQFNPAQFAQARAYLGTYDGRRKDRRPHRRLQHQGAGFAVPVHDQLHPDGQPVPRQGGQVRLEDLCREAVRHRPVQIRQGGAASAHGAAAEQRILGQGRGCRSRTGWC